MIFCRAGWQAINHFHLGVEDGEGTGNSVPGSFKSHFFIISGRNGTNTHVWIDRSGTKLHDDFFQTARKQLSPNGKLIQ